MILDSLTPAWGCCARSGHRTNQTFFSSSMWELYNLSIELYNNVAN